MVLHKACNTARGRSSLVRVKQIFHSEGLLEEGLEHHRVWVPGGQHQ